MNYTPTSGKAEIHLTYKCNLSCVNCNRASFLDNPPTEDMTVDDFRDFLRQCDELNFKPNLVLIGGEPTIHKDFVEFCRLAAEWCLPKGLWYQVWSNATTEEAKAKLRYVNEKYHASIPADTHKDRSMILSQDDIYVSPKDFGIEREYCYAHGASVCGFAVDHDGYMPCSIGGMVDGMLGLGLRTKRLADLFDNEKAEAVTKKMCEHCGHNLSHMYAGKELKAWRENVDGCKKKYGARFSKTWLKASEGKR